MLLLIFDDVEASPDGSLRAVVLTALLSSLSTRLCGGRFGVTPSIPRVTASHHSETSGTNILKCRWAEFLQQIPPTLLLWHPPRPSHLHKEWIVCHTWAAPISPSIPISSSILISVSKSLSMLAVVEPPTPLGLLFGRMFTALSVS